jgi:putative transposase
MADHQGHRDGPNGLRWGVESICRQLTELGVLIAPSTYYDHINRQPSRRQVLDETLKAQITRVHAANYGVYGARKVWLALNREGIADLHREHIETFKTGLATHPTPTTGKPLNRVSIKNALINLHCFLTRITEWGYPNPPARPLMFPVTCR